MRVTANTFSPTLSCHVLSRQVRGGEETVEGVLKEPKQRIAWRVAIVFVVFSQRPRDGFPGISFEGKCLPV